MTITTEAPLREPAVVSTEWRPRIVAFLCNWCSYTGADLAGISRIQWDPSVSIVRVMCSGRMDPTFVAKAFRMGADGVIISGCHPGDCHYQEGNYKTLRRVHLLQRLIEGFGIDRERLGAHAEGLIGTSACLAGEICSLLLGILQIAGIELL